MHAAGGDADHGVSGDDARSVQETFALDDADAKAGKVVFARRMHPGMLGGLAANQRAAGELAAARNSRDDPGGDVHVQPLRYVVVEKEKGFGADHQDVVDRHSHKVDADLVVRVVLGRELELGSDTIGSSDEHGIAVTLRHAEQAPEPADAAEHLGTASSLNSGYDALDQRVAGIDIDPGCFVGQRVFGVHDPR